MFKPFAFYIYLFLFWGLYRLIGNFSEPVDEFIFKPLIWLLPILIIIKFWEKRKILKSLQFNFNDIWQDAVYGISVSLLIFSIFTLSVYLKFGKLNFNPYNLTLFSSLPFLFTSLATAIVEETTFRGFLLTRTAKAVNSKLYANIITTVGFILIHIPLIVFVKGLSGYNIFSYLLTSASLSFADGYLFYKREGLVAPIASHWIWNFVALMVV